MNFFMKIKKSLEGAAREKAKEELEEEMADVAPWYLKCWFPCFGVVGTIRTCFCCAPQEVKDKAKPILDRLDQADSNAA
eukprot:CAMPEP_0117685382 /NCGR_PEP_ID=MMETSP0804-20121206/21702_1 /TAXON_ID=1074897 /ORGANISM="Tetraselmis astigmatica, Strain CCMP880" /LENGTH=78 /DNA_ID=CAMNT_0005496635 /DNA_START=180 /DNA_END=416 /DNA_ORIENTATION=-